MDVKEFLIHFKNEIAVTKSSDWSYEKYLKWQPEFFQKTLPFHRSAKQSYFEQSHRLIDKEKYAYNRELIEFQYLGLFVDEDDIEFANLIKKVAGNLVKIDNEDEMEAALGYLWNMIDFFVHEIERSDKLSNALEELKVKIDETKKLGSKDTRDQVIRFIDLFIPEA